jgi:hypothetical protein
MTDAEKRKARDEIRMLEGLPPHNHPGNLCYGDGYFAKSLVDKYGVSISELKKKVGMV